jgi:hypothetical protein
MGGGCPDPSFAEFLAVAIGMKNELNAIGKNFNQAVKRLHQNYYSSGIKDSLEFYDSAQFTLLQEVGEIKSILAR